MTKTNIKTLVHGHWGLLAGIILICIAAATVAWWVTRSHSIPWIVYYGDQPDTAPFAPYRVLVIESERNIPIRELVRRGKTVLGYASLGEVHDTREYFQEAADAGVLLENQKNWPGSHKVDVRNPEWHRIFLERVIAKVLETGVSGVFLDTLDTPLHLEDTDPERFAGMKDATAQLIAELRAAHPNIIIMQNRGFDVLEKTAPNINMLLAESIFASHNFETKTNECVQPSFYYSIARMIHGVQMKNPHLAVMTLDYWPLNERKIVNEIYQTQRSQGFHPYVTNISLMDITPE